MHRLTGNTAVRNPDTDAIVILVEGDELPTWAEGLVGSHLLDEGVGATAYADDESSDDDESTTPAPWVIADGGKYLGTKGRFVSNRKDAAEFDSQETAQARLDELAEHHHDAVVETAPTPDVQED